MNYLIWIPSEGETIQSAHKLEHPGNEPSAAKDYIKNYYESNWPDDFPIYELISIVKCDNDFSPISKVVQVNIHAFQSIDVEITSTKELLEAK